MPNKQFTPSTLQRRLDSQAARVSIGARLLWSYLISATLPLLVVGALLLYNGLATQRENVYSEQRNLANRTARNVASYLGDAAKLLGNYELLVRPSSTTVDDWRAEAERLTEQAYPNMPEFAVLDAQGKELVRIEQLQAVAPSELHSYTADPQVQRVLASQQWFFTPSAAQDDTQLVTLLMPLRNDAGTTIGAMRAVINAAPIAAELRSAIAGTNSYAYLLQSVNANVIFSDAQAGFRVPEHFDQLLHPANTAQEYTGAHGLGVVGALTPVVLANERDTGWVVVTEQPSAVAFSDLRRNILLLGVLVLIVIGSVLVWALRQARFLLVPLSELRSGALVIGSGHLDHRIAVHRNDELGDVARAFNHMAGQLTVSLDQIERQNEHLRSGLALARDIQLGLLPDRAPWAIDEVAVFARSIPAYEVGGDFYSYIALSDGRAAVAIGDISGKGVGAALLMSLTSSAVESHGRELEHPAEVLRALNQLLAARLKANHMNAALMFVVFEPREQLLRIANAGMIAPVLITASGSHFVDVFGLPIGALPDIVYRDITVPIAPGDMLLLLSDGVVEAHNPQGEMYGFERLEALLADFAPITDVQQLVEGVLQAVQAFIGEAAQHDDITLVAVRPALAPEKIVFEHEEYAVGYATV